MLVSPTCKLGCCWRKIQYASNLYNEYSLQVKSLKNENNYYIQKQDKVFSCMLKTEKRDLGKCDLVIVTRHFRASKHKIVRRKNQQKFAS